MKLGAVKSAWPLILFWITTGCRTADPAAHFIAQLDHAPPEKRPKNWEQTKSLIARPAPQVGQLAPDFTLPSSDGAEAITRSAWQMGRPLVLIFGSFT
jgi:hypothetical protein